MEILADYGNTFIILAVVLGIFMTWGIGANDVANAMGTSVGAKAISFKQAILIAAVFEFAGAFLAGGHVTKTIRKGIIDPTPILNSPDILVFGMLAALLAAAIWLAVASYMGWPVSTTHSIVGAIVGFAVAGIGVDAVNWSKVLTIVVSWGVSPVLGGTLAFLLMKSIQRFILDAETPFKNAVKFSPFYLFLVGFLISLVTLFKGLKHLNLELTGPQSFLAAIIFGVLVAIMGKMIVAKIKLPENASVADEVSSIERVFAVMMVFTACSMAFAHGSNDVANGIGPMAAVVDIVRNGGQVAQESTLPMWILLVGGGGIVFGLATYGWKVMKTIGTKITELTPTRGFSAELAAAATVVLASRTGIPVSTTHVAVGCVLGVGMARGLGALNLRVVGGIFTSWIITLPVGAALSIFFFFIFKTIFT